MKTVAEIIAKHFHYDVDVAESIKPITAAALRDFGREVGESVKDECEKQTIRSLNPFEVNQFIQAVDVDKFIK